MKKKNKFLLVFILIAIILVIYLVQSSQNKKTNPNITNNSTNDTITNLNTNQSQVKIANWNIQIFGDSKEQNETLLDIYRNKIKSYDIIFIQEIRDSDQTAFPKLCSKLIDYNCIASSRAGRSSIKEQIGIVYKKGIILQNLTDYNPDSQDRWERPPIKTIFEINQKQISIYNMHVDPDTAKKEITELEKLVEPIGSVVVLGDFNADCNYYNRDSAGNFVNWHWLITDENDTTVHSTNCAYDRIIVNDDMFKKFKSVGIDSSGINPSVSDHYLVWAAFE